MCCALLPLLSRIGSPFPQEICTVAQHINCLNQSMQLAAVSWSLADDNTYKALFPVSRSHASVITYSTH